jgi:hypothetical protein
MMLSVLNIAFGLTQVKKTTGVPKSIVDDALVTLSGRYDGRFWERQAIKAPARPVRAGVELSYLCLLTSALSNSGTTSAHGPSILSVRYHHEELEQMVSPPTSRWVSPFHPIPRRIENPGEMITIPVWNADME